jgi:putative transposase
MLKAYKYRIYPNKTQKVLFTKTFGCVRYFWNKQVEIFNSYNKEINSKPEYKTSTKLRNEIDWMQEVSAAAIQQKENDFKEYKQQKFNKNRKTKINFPNFKKKSNKQSFRLPNQKFSLKDNKIRLEKIGYVKIIIDRIISNNIKFISVTISKNPSNQYFVSILVEQDIKSYSKTGKEVGIDMGLKQFITQSDGVIIGNPHYFRNSQTKLTRLQQRLDKKVKGSSRRLLTKLKVARLHQTISNQRDWFLHNESLRLVRDYDKIYIEDLNIKGLSARCKPKQDENGKYLPNGQSAKSGLNKSIQDVSISKFFDMLEYKSNWYGKELIKIGRFEPSSKTCHNCGWVNHNLTLKDRVFNCPVCGLSIDRDLNAAMNIKALGVNNAIQTSSELSTVCDEMSKVA